MLERSHSNLISQLKERKTGMSIVDLELEDTVFIGSLESSFVLSCLRLINESSSDIWVEHDELKLKILSTSERLPLARLAVQSADIQVVNNLVIDFVFSGLLGGIISEVMVDSVNSEDTSELEGPFSEVLGELSVVALALGEEFITEKVQRTGDDGSRISSSLNGSCQNDIIASGESLDVAIEVVSRVGVGLSSQNTPNLEVLVGGQGHTNTSIEN